MSLRRIDWTQIDSINVPVGNTIDIGKINGPIHSVYAENLFVSGSSVIDVIKQTSVGITGGTYDNQTGTITFVNATGGTFPIDGFVTGMTDTYITGGTLTGGTLVLYDNFGHLVNINGNLTTEFVPLSGGTMRGTLYVPLVSATTIDIGSTSSGNPADGVIKQNNVTIYHSAGTNNLFFGRLSGNFSGITGQNNTAYGGLSLRNITIANNNAVFGSNGLYSNITGNTNTSIGNQAGFSSLGSGNVYLGYQSGYQETGSNKLYISNTSTTTPLIYGEFDNNLVVINNTLSATTISANTISATTISGETFFGNGSGLTLTSNQIITGLTYTPYNTTNPNGYISGITSGNVTTALGYTPYNSTNPNGYITGYTDTYVTGFTYNNANTFSLQRNQGQSALTATINTMTGLTVSNSFNTSGSTFNIGQTINSGATGGIYSLISGNTVDSTVNNPSRSVRALDLNIDSLSGTNKSQLIFTNGGTLSNSTAQQTPSLFINRVSGSAGLSALYFSNSGTIQAGIRYNTSGLIDIGAFQTGGNIPTFYSNNAEAARFGTTGNLLIGTTTDAGYKLDVNGSTRTQGIAGFGVALSAVSGTPGIVLSSTGGTLSASTYYYKIVAVDVFGNTTTGSTEVSGTTTGSTSSVTLTWTSVTNAVSYRIYRGTATNTQTLYYTSTSSPFTDTNFSGFTSGSVPTANTTYLVQVGNSGTYKLDVGGSMRVVNPSFTGQLTIAHTASNTQVITGGPAGENITFGPTNRIFLNAGQVSLGQNYLTNVGTLETINRGGSAGDAMLIQHQGSLVGGSGITQNFVRIFLTVAQQLASPVANILHINPTLNNSTGTTGTAIIRGIYYNPVVTNLTNTTHRAWENTTGDVYMCSTSGNTGIGTVPTTSYKLDVSGNTRIGASTSGNKLNVLGTDNEDILTVNWGGSNSIGLGSNTANNPILRLGVIRLTAHPSGARLIMTGCNTFGNLGGSATMGIEGNVVGTSVGTIVRLTSTALQGANRHNPISGTLNMVTIGDAITNQYIDFSPASGSATFNSLYIRQQLNTSGSYSGIVRGVFYDPILTSTTGINHRAWENTTGDMLFGTTTGSTGIGANTSINASAILDVTSTTKGMLPPRMTTVQMTGITSPATALELYNTDAKMKLTYDGTAYKSSGIISGSISSGLTASTTITVIFGGTQPNITYKVNVTPTSELSAALFYVTNKTTTTFDVMYLAGLTGIVTFDYSVSQ